MLDASAAAQTESEPIAQVLARHLGLRRADDELHRLTFAITALGVQTILGKDLCMAIRPRLLTAPGALDTTVRRLADYAQALVRSEAARRRRDASPKRSAS